MCFEAFGGFVNASVFIKNETQLTSMIGTLVQNNIELNKK